MRLRSRSWMVAALFLCAVAVPPLRAAHGPALASLALPLVVAQAAPPPAPPPWVPLTPGQSARAQGRGTDDRNRSVRGRSDRPVTPAGDAIQVTVATTWLAWWEANQDEYLWTVSFPDAQTGEVERRGVWPDTGWAPQEAARTSGGRGQLTGRGRVERVDPESPIRRLTRAEIVPALVEVLATADEEPLTSTAVLALCRAAGRDDNDEIDALVTERLGDKVLPVQMAAAFGLGLRGTRGAVGPLLELARNSPGGRRYVRGQNIPWQVRLASLLALGFSDDRAALPILLDIVKKEGNTDERIGPNAVTALGLLGEEARGRSGAALLELADDEMAEPLLRAAALLALGRMGDADARPLLIERVNDRDTRRIERQSAALALGRVGHPDDPASLDALRRVVATAKDETHRHFGWISLGRMGENDRNEMRNAEVHGELVDYLASELDETRLDMDRPWVALAAGLYARARPSALPVLAPPLREAYRRVGDPLNRGAYVIALGLLRDTESGPKLLEHFDEVHLPEFRAHAATALGLMEFREASEALREEALENDVDRIVLRGIALGLRMMLDVQAVEDLREALAGSGSTTERVKYAEALGILGHPDAVPDLIAFAQDDSQHPAARAAACDALARISEGAAPPWRARLTIDSNYVEEIGSMPELFVEP